MKYNHQEPQTKDHALIVAVISAFRPINPSYTDAHTWYTKHALASAKPSPLARSVKSKYYMPLFGSVFASALALVMILTSQNNPLPTGTVALKTAPSANPELATFSSLSSDARSVEVKEDRQILAKIDAQSKATSRTQADESFTESLNVETSLQDLFQ